MLAVPLTAMWVMPWGLASLALMPLGLERIALVPMGWGISLLQAIAHSVAAWPGAVVGVAQMPAWGLALVAAGLAWAGLWRGWLRLAGIAPLLAGLASPLLVRPPDVLVTPQSSVIALRVGGHTLVEASATATPFEVQAPGRVWGGTTEPLGGTGPRHLHRRRLPGEHPRPAGGAGAAPRRRHLRGRPGGVRVVAAPAVRRHGAGPLHRGGRLGRGVGGPGRGPRDDGRHRARQAALGGAGTAGFADGADGVSKVESYAPCNQGPYGQADALTHSISRRKQAVLF